MDIRILRMAHLLVDYSTDIQPGDRVMIQAGPLAAPLVRAIYKRVLERGGHPTTQINLSGLEEIFYRQANEKQLTYVDPLREMVIGEFEATIRIRALENTRELSGVDPERQTLHSKANQDLSRSLWKEVPREN